MSQSRSTKRIRLARASNAGAKQSPLGFVGSLALHGLIVAATFFTWQHSLLIADESPPVVPVELVTIGQKTNIKAVAPKTEEFKPSQEVQITAPKVADTIPPPKEIATPKVEMAPPPPEEATSEPLIKPAPTPPQPKLKPQPEKPEKKKFDINSLSALLNKVEPSSQANPNAHTGAHPMKGIGAQNAMTMDLVDALRNEIAQCWTNPPIGAPNPADLIVEYEIFLNPDGTLAGAPRLIGQSRTGGSYARAAADAAQRAIYTCVPYKLPADRYRDWHDITITFDPRQMMGQ
jgi:hypothetical protein